MLTVMMECDNQEAELAQTLSVLVAGAVEGLVSDVAVLDRGSADGSAKVADAAGCRFYLDWALPATIEAARGEWLLLLEAGARPQGAWIDEIAEHLALSRNPACFTGSSAHRLPLHRRLLRKAPALERGLLLPKPQALQAARSAASLGDLARGGKVRRLSSQLVPAWVARQARA